MTVLQEIVDTKREEVERTRRRLPLEVLRDLSGPTASPFRLSRALLDTPIPRVIAEVKRASPSAGIIRTGHWDPEALAASYADGGACALSVLTDIQFFWGDPSSLEGCAKASGLPVLRKDFIVDPYQIDESRWLGADAVLLIARVLAPETLLECAARARSLGMDALVEIHHDRELAVALAAEHAIIGVNHRDLDTLEIDLGLSARLRDRIPTQRITVAESGVSSREQVARLVDGGYGNFLIGEHLARHDDPASALRSLRAVGSH